MNENMLERLAPKVILAYSRDLSTITGALQRALTIVQNLFPFMDHEGLTYEYWIGENKREVMATFQPFDVEASIASRQPPGAPYRGDLPKIARKIKLGEKESIILDRIKQNAVLPADVKALIAKQYDDVTRMRNAVLARYLKAALDAVATGALTITDENGMTLTVDFGVPAAQQETLAGANLWSDPTADIYAKEMSWLETMTDADKPIGRVLTSEKVVRNMLANDKLREMVLKRAYGAAVIPNLTRAELDDWRARQGLPPIVTLDAQVNVENAAGALTATRFLPQNRYILLPAEKLGDTLVGTTAEARRAARDGVLDYGEVTGIWAGQWDAIEPPVQWTKAAAIMFPTFPGADQIFQGSVLA